ncbi:MAG: TetR/AcrR family transcriptional regulator [Brachybacterium sp.]|uniref:TetR/AcrR family transcriptional regulator n=1 Tax=unclassified Brachybacterium TaxID=2623841 RepID=UPI003F8EE5FE
MTTASAADASEPAEPVHVSRARSGMADGDIAAGTMRRLREGRRASTVGRATTTRSAIASAVVSLSTAGKPLTVSAVVREAGVSRPTFYTHFADLDDVIVMIHEQALAEVASWQQRALEGPEHWSEPDAQQESFRRFAEYVDQHRELYATIFELPTGAEVRRRVSRVMADALQARLEKVATPPEGISAEAISSALAAAYTHLLGMWVRGELEATVDDVMAHLTVLMPAWLMDPATPPTAADRR